MVTPPLPPLRLFFEPSETPRILIYLSTHGKATPKAACADLGISLHTWYDGLQRLEDLGLIIVEVPPGGRRRQGFEVTPNGHGALRLLHVLPEMVTNSKAALEWELGASSRAPLNERLGEVLCRLIEIAERSGEMSELKDLQRKAKERGLDLEASLAGAVRLVLSGNPREAIAALGHLPAHPAPASHSRTLRKAHFFLALALLRCGEERRAYDHYALVKRMAVEARDFAAEADAHLAMGIIKGSKGQFPDALSHLDRALAAAKKSGLASKEAKVLISYGLFQWFVDPAAGLDRTEEARRAAQKCGARVLLVHVHANRALMLAAAGERKAAVEALQLARSLAKTVGHELGDPTADAWFAIVRGIIRRRRPVHPSDCQGPILALLRTPR